MLQQMPGSAAGYISALMAMTVINNLRK